MIKVFINPGHCPGVDPGAVGPAGNTEAAVVKRVGRKLADYLDAAGCTCRIVQEDSLADICNQANEWNSDLFVSLHCNSAGSAQAHGTEIYTSRGQTAADPLATCIMNQISATLPDLYVRADYSDGDVDKEAGFFVLNHTAMPAVLVELAFISNEFEEQFLIQEDNQKLMAAAIARGVTDYLNL